MTLYICTQEPGDWRDQVQYDHCFEVRMQQEWRDRIEAFGPQILTSVLWPTGERQGGVAGTRGGCRGAGKCAQGAFAQRRWVGAGEGARWVHPRGRACPLARCRISRAHAHLLIYVDVDRPQRGPDARHAYRARGTHRVRANPPR